MFPPRPHYQWSLAGGRALELGPRTRIMGILNVTPDSFSDGGRWANPALATVHLEGMLRDGADLIDIGGESTRPGSEPVPQEEELRRVLPVIREGVRLGAMISIDTTKVAVARAAVEAGAVILNDVSGLRFDPGLADVARESGAGLILMHSRGTPRDMQQNPRYHHVLNEVADELGGAARRALDRGVTAGQLVVDPGIGFAKSFEHNLELLRGLDRIVAGGRPVLVGLSRKSFIGRILDVEVGDRLEGSLAAAVTAALAGAHVVRVHDVRATARALKVADALRSPEGHEA